MAHYELECTIFPFEIWHLKSAPPTRIYSPEFQRVTAAALPALPGIRHAIAFLNTPTADPHWRLVESFPDDDLYIHLPK